MRVTQQMMNNTLLLNLQRNSSRLFDLNSKISSTLRITKPSDDPVGASFAMRYRSERSANEQYQENVDRAMGWLEFTDIVVGQSVDIVKKAHELAVLGANSTNTKESRGAIAAEIEQLLAQLREIAQSQFNGMYIFNGQRIDKPPYDAAPPYLDSEADLFDEGRIEYELSPGVVVSVNFHAGEIYGYPGEEGNIFNILHDLSAALREEDQLEIEANLGKLNKSLDRMLEAWADLGAKVNRVQLIDQRLKDNYLNVRTLLSKTEDLDMAEAFTYFKMAEHVYQASLSSGARIIQPSLLDFLR